MSTVSSLNKDIKKRWGGLAKSSACLKKKKTGDVNSGVLAQGHGVFISIIIILLFHS